MTFAALVFTEGNMTRTTERGIWIGVIVLLLAIGAALFFSPAGHMLAMCSGMMGNGMEGGMRY